MPSLHIGIDLDNTIVDYEPVFGEVGVAIGLLRPELGLTGKAAVKNHLMNRSEEHWMRLQGQVYGRFMDLARPYPGVVEFVTAVRHRDTRVTVVSHKTRLGHFDVERLDLWDAARAWLARNGLVGAAGIAESDIHFAETREAKLARIAELGCDFFVDDLVEVLRHPEFPAATQAIWFAQDKPEGEGRGLNPYRSWAEIQSKLLAPA